MDDPNLQRLLSQLISSLKPEQVYLFGSRARGDANPDSDYDFMVVLPDDAPPENLRRKNLFHKFKSHGFYADVFPVPRKRFDMQRRYIGTLPHIAAKWGQQIYG